MLVLMTWLPPLQPSHHDSDGEQESGQNSSPLTVLPLCTHTLLRDFSSVTQVQPSSLHCSQKDIETSACWPPGRGTGQECLRVSRPLVLALCSLDQWERFHFSRNKKREKEPLPASGHLALLQPRLNHCPSEAPAQGSWGHTLWRAVSVTSQAT